MNGWSFEGEHLLHAGPRSWTVYGWSPENENAHPEIEITVIDKLPVDANLEPRDRAKRIAKGIASWVCLTGEYEMGQGQFIQLIEPTGPFPSFEELVGTIQKAFIGPYQAGERVALDYVAVSYYLHIPEKRLAAAINHLVQLKQVKMITRRLFELTAEGAKQLLDHQAGSTGEFVERTSGRVIERIAGLDQSVASELKQLLEAENDIGNSEAEAKGFANSVRDLIQRATDAFYKKIEPSGSFTTAEVNKKVSAISKLHRSNRGAKYLIATSETIDAHVRAHSGIVARGVHEVPEHRGRLLLYTLLLFSDILDLLE